MLIPHDIFYQPHLAVQKCKFEAFQRSSYPKLKQTHEKKQIIIIIINLQAAITCQPLRNAQVLGGYFNLAL